MDDGHATARRRVQIINTYGLHPIAIRADTPIGLVIPFPRGPAAAQLWPDGAEIGGERRPAGDDTRECIARGKLHEHHWSPDRRPNGVCSAGATKPGTADDLGFIPREEVGGIRSEGASRIRARSDRFHGDPGTRPRTRNQSMNIHESTGGEL
jgi:hypothetical protein